MASPPQDITLDDQVVREREYHNRRFAEQEPRKQAKYYYAVEPMEHDFAVAIKKFAKGADVLEYGCGDRAVLHDLAPCAHAVTGIDISDVAVERSLALAKARSLENAMFLTMNAEAMTFSDDSFDLIFGSGIIHHLSIEKSLQEIHRTLRPNGRALFLEPLGHNPVINCYRRFTPSARTEDEHPLLRSDFRNVREIFEKVETRHYGLLSLASVPFRNTLVGGPARALLHRIDTAIFALGPCRWLSWFVLVELRK